MVPPPTPKRPLKAPAAVPIAASWRLRGTAGDTSAVPANVESDELGAALRSLLSAPERSAVLSDLDGTLAPIVAASRAGGGARARPARPCGRSPRATRLTAVISGRRATEAKRLVGLDEITYSGNHGFEMLLPGESEPRPYPSLDGHEEDAPRFVAGHDAGGAGAGGDPNRGQGGDRRPALARGRQRGRGRVARERDRQRGRVAGAGRPSRPQGAGDQAERPDQQGDRGRRPGARAHRWTRRSTAATTAPTWTRSPRCARSREDGELDAASLRRDRLRRGARPRSPRAADLVVEGPPGFLEALRRLAGRQRRWPTATC